MNISGKVNISSAMRGRLVEYRHTPVLKYNVSYPVFSSREYRGSIDRMNKHYSAAAQAFIKNAEIKLLPAAVADYYNSVKNNFPIHMYEADLSFTATYNRECVVSLYMDNYEYTGGAHGTTVRSSDTWNVRRGQRLALTELFPNDKFYLNTIRTEIIRQIGEAPENYFENYAQLVTETFNPQSFYLTDEGLAIYFQQYDIAPYSTGIPTFIMP